MVKATDPLPTHSTLHICSLIYSSMRMCSAGAPNAAHVAAAGFAIARSSIKPFISTAPRIARLLCALTVSVFFFRSNDARAEPVSATTAETRRASEPAISRWHADHVSEPKYGTSAPHAMHGCAHFTRYGSMLLENICSEAQRTDRFKLVLKACRVCSSPAPALWGTLSCSKAKSYISR